MPSSGLHTNTQTQRVSDDTIQCGTACGTLRWHRAQPAQPPQTSGRPARGHKRSAITYSPTAQRHRLEAPQWTREQAAPAGQPWPLRSQRPQVKHCHLGTTWFLRGKTLTRVVRYQRKQARRFGAKHGAQATVRRGRWAQDLVCACHFCAIAKSSDHHIHREVMCGSGVARSLSAEAQVPALRRRVLHHAVSCAL